MQRAALGTALAAVMALLAGCAQPPSREHMFEAVDVDGDQAITSAEIVRFFFQTGFAQLDQDQDGQITKREWGQAEPQRSVPKLFGALDANGDEAVSPEELSSPENRQKAVDGLLRKVDRDQDGVLSKAEALGPSEAEKTRRRRKLDEALFDGPAFRPSVDASTAFRRATR